MNQISNDRRKCPKCNREVRWHNPKGNVRKTDACKLTRGKVCALLSIHDPLKAFRFGSRASVLADLEKKLGV